MTIAAIWAGVVVHCAALLWVCRAIDRYGEMIVATQREDYDG